MRTFSTSLIATSKKIKENRVKLSWNGVKAFQVLCTVKTSFQFVQGKHWSCRMSNRKGKPLFFSGVCNMFLFFFVFFFEGNVELEFLFCFPLRGHFKHVICIGL